MKKLNMSMLGGLIIALVGCNSGSSNTPSTGGLTQYNLQNYKLTAVQTNNCTLSGNSTLNCDSHRPITGGIYSITFNTPVGVPGAYVMMPPEGDTYGLNIAATGGGCEQKAPESGITYTCNFTIGSNGTSQAGKTVYLQVNGALGKAKIVTININ